MLVGEAVEPPTNLKRSSSQLFDTPTKKRIKKEWEDTITQRVYDCLGIIPQISTCCGSNTALLITAIAESLAVDPIAILSVLLPIVAFLTGSNCMIKPDSVVNWEEPLILYSLLVGKKGSKKSPILKTLMEPLTKIIQNLDSVDLIFQEGTLEGLTNQLMINKGEMLQVANESETFFNKLYSQKDENKFRTQYLNFHGGGKFKHITKTKGAVEIPNVSLNFIGCIHPESVIRFLNREDQNHDGLLERFIMTCFRSDSISLDQIRQNTFDGKVLEDFYFKIFEFFHSITRKVDFDSEEVPKKILFIPENYSFDKIYDSINSKKQGTLDDVYLGEYSKMPGTVLRLSALLHIMEESLSSDSIDFVIKPSMVEKGLNLAQCFMNQRVILKAGHLKNFENDTIVAEPEHIEAIAINPSPDIVSLVQRILYLKGSNLSVSDIIRSKILKDEKEIVKILRIIEISKFGTISIKTSNSNRNSGKEMYFLTKYISNFVLSTAQGRARFNLFRLNKGLFDKSFNQ